MKKGKYCFSSIIFFLGLIACSLILKADPSLQAIPFTLTDSLSGFHDSTWITEDFDGKKATEKTEKISSVDFFGSDHLLRADSMKPEPLAKNPDRDWIIWVVIVSLGALAFARLLFPHRARQFFSATLGGRHFNQMERDGSFFDESPAWLMFFNFLIILALLVYQTLLQTGILVSIETLPPLIIFLILFGLLLLYYPAKSLITSFFAWVFKTGQANNAYTKNIFLYNNLAGIIILPIVIYNAYNPGTTGLYLAWALLVIINIAKMIRGAVIGYTQAGFSAYYLILYLCAIELAPLLILAKAVGNYLLPV
jgi:hypothetical protein